MPTRKNGFFTFVRTPYRVALVNEAERIIIGCVNLGALGVEGVMHIALTFMLINYSLVQQHRPKWLESMRPFVTDLQKQTQGLASKGQFMFTRKPHHVALVNALSMLTRRTDQTTAANMDYALLFLIANWDYIQRINPDWSDDQPSLDRIIAGEKT